MNERKSSTAQANCSLSTMNKVDRLLVAVSIKVPLLSTGYHIPHAPAAGSAVASRVRAHMRPRSILMVPVTAAEIIRAEPIRVVLSARQ